MTSLQDLLGIELPIIQAPMAGVQGSALAIAVSNAGGLGSLPCAMLAIDAIRKELDAIKAGTAHPFNVNFFCHEPPARTPRAKRHGAPRSPRTTRKWGSTSRACPQVRAARRSTMKRPTCLKVASPRSSVFISACRRRHCSIECDAWGSKIFSSATTVEEARWLEARGVDAIIAQGLEAGGHRGIFLSSDVSTQLGTIALLPQIVDAVKLPVIAAGGIADAKGVAAAFALGAAAVQVGTAYLLCPEATTSMPCIARR